MLLIMYHSPLPPYLDPLRPKYVQHPILQHHQPAFLPQCKEQVSHQSKTKGKIMVLYISIAIFLNGKLEDKRFYNE